MPYGFMPHATQYTHDGIPYLDLLELKEPCFLEQEMKRGDCRVHLSRGLTPSCKTLFCARRVVLNVRRFAPAWTCEASASNATGSVIMAAINA